MNFDLNTAMAVKERDDGLLEKDTFNISTAVPVEEIRAARPGEIPYSPPAIKERANVELMFKERGEKVPSGLEFEWELTSPQKQAATNVIATTALTGGLNLAVQGVRGVADKESKGNLFDRVFKGIVYPEATARLYEKLPGTKDLPNWAKLTAGIADDIISYGVTAVVKGGIKETLLAKDIYRKLDVPATEYAKDKMKGFLPAGQLTEKQAFEGYKQEYRNIALKKFTSIEAEIITSEEAIGAGQAGGSSQLQEYARKRSLLGLIIDDLKHTNSKGQLQLPKVGQSIGFKNPKGEISEGIIRKVTGELAEIELLNQPGKIIVATLSQLSLPEAPETSVLAPKEAQGGKISPQAEQGLTLAIKLNSGEVISDTSAKLHSDIVTSKGINPDEVADVGILNKEGQYQGTHTLQGKALETLPEVPEELLNKVRGMVEKPKEEPIINLKNLSISEEAKTNIENIASEVAPELEKIKGETLTHSEVLEAAKSSELLTKLINRTQSKEVEAAILRTRQHLSALAEGKGVSEDFIKTLKIVKSFGTDTARKLGSLRIAAGSNEYNLKTKLVNDLTDRGVEIEKIIKEAEGVDFNNQEQVTNFYRKFVKPKIWDLINEYRYINLLSSPKTHIVNLFSNLIQVSGLAPATKVFSGDIKGAKAYYQGAINSIGEASTKALEALKGITFVERPDVPRLPTGSKILKPFRYIPQALEASDVFFRTIAYEGELASQLAQGVSKGEAEELAKEKASYFVFRKALDPKNKTGQGKLLSAIDNLTAMIYKSRSVPIFGKAISWYIPFIQTPMNIAKQMIEYSPAGVTTLPGAKNKKEQLAKAYIGSLVFALAAYLVYKNDSTWSIPSGKKEKELFYASGRQPFSIKIGDTWVGYSRLGPLALPIAIPAAIKYYTQENPRSVTDTALQKQANVLGGIGEFFASMSYVEGVGQLMNLVKNAPGALSKLVAEAPAQLIPLASLQRWINNFFIDPIYRKTDKEISAESIIDNARKSIIFSTKGLPAFENPDGEVSRRTYPGLNAFSPIPLSKSNKEYEDEYKDYIIERKEKLLDEVDQEDKPSRRKRVR
jgi:hypothetical protein